MYLYIRTYLRAHTPDKRLAQTGELCGASRLASVLLYVNHRSLQIPDTCLGNLQRLLRLHVSWDMLVDADVVAVAKTFRSQIEMASRAVVRELEEAQRDLEAILHLDLTKDEFLDIYDPVLLQGTDGGHPLLASWHDASQESSAILQDVSFGTAGVSQVVTQFFRRRNAKEVWPRAYQNVHVFFQRPGELSISIFGQDDEWEALEACFGQAQDWGMFD